MRVLAIESSCDESAAAVFDEARGLLAHELFSQVELHRIFGGVVPELASRDHVRRLLPLVKSALALAATDPGAFGRGVYGRAGPDRCSADRRGAGTQSRLWVADSGPRCASSRGT